MPRTLPDQRPASPSPSQLPPVPNSPTYSYASTANRLSAYNLPPPPPPRPAHTVLTQADLEQSQQAYSDLLATAKSYRLALATLSTAASAFGSALESCARLKESRAEALTPQGASGGGGGSGGLGAGAGAGLTGGPVRPLPRGSCTADLIMGASGVHHLIANHQQILSETVYRSFEVPLLHELDAWRRAVDDEEESYRTEAAARSREIRRLEKEGLKLHRQRRRDVGVLREHLVVLTAKLDGLTTLHADHARNLLRDGQDASARVLDASCSLVRAEVDIFESLARKGWSGGGLDLLLENGRDLFAPDDDADLPPPGLTGGPAAAAKSATAAAASDGARLFSILPPKSILADTASDRTRPSGGGAGRSTSTGGAAGAGGSGSAHNGRADSLLMGSDAGGDRYQSLLGAVDVDPDDLDRGRSTAAATDADSDSIFSDLNLPRHHNYHPQQQQQPQHQQPRSLRPFSPQPIRRLPTDVVMDPETLLSDDDDDEFGIGSSSSAAAAKRPGFSSAAGAGRDVTARAMGLDLDLDLDIDGDEGEGEGEDEDGDETSPWRNEPRPSNSRGSDDTAKKIPSLDGEAGYESRDHEGAGAEDGERGDGERGDTVREDGEQPRHRDRSPSPSPSLNATDAASTPEERDPAIEENGDQDARR